MKKGNEPQSYGSQGEWVKGKTGQTVDRTPQKPDRPDESFYESRHQSDRSATDQGGKISPAIAADATDPVAPDSSKTPVSGDSGKKVTENAAGGTRKSYFKDRDYSN